MFLHVEHDFCATDCFDVYFDLFLLQHGHCFSSLSRINATV